MNRDNKRSMPPRGTEIPPPSVVAGILETYWVLDGHTPVRARDIRDLEGAYEDIAKRRVAETTVRTASGTYWVSTVFLGIDHNFMGGPPLLFETMVFDHSEGAESCGDDLATRRYSTWEQAERGHAAMVAWVAAGMPEGEEPP